MIKPIPLDIHEGQIAHHRERERAAGRKEIEDDRALEALVSAGAKMRKNAETAREMAEAISADKTVAGVTYRQRYADDTAKLEAIAAKRMDEAMNAVLGEIGRLSKTITPATPSDKHLASEIRATLARLPEKEREEQLARASDTVIEALAAAPAFVTRMSDAALEHRIKSWQVSKFPDEVARLRRLGNALNAAREVSVSFKGYVAELASTMAQPIIERSVKRTEAAKEAVTAAIAE
jgi:hypothetical protein